MKKEEQWLQVNNYLWIEDYCLEKQGVYKKHKDEWGADLYMIDDKFFIMVGQDKAGKEIITLKQNIATNEKLQKEYPKMIVPGYYMNKQHWSSVYFDEKPTNELLKRMIDEAYEVLLSSFSKKRQMEIEDGII